AVEVLEDAGFRVAMQPERLCCGRPLYDYGMLDLAKRKLRQILDELRDELARGTPVVGLEPACVATFRDELCEVCPHDEDAKRLPKARQFPPATLLIADGFSCREQVEQGAGKVPLHIAQVVQLAVREKKGAPLVRSRRRAIRRAAIAGGIAAVAVGALLVVRQ